MIKTDKAHFNISRRGFLYGAGALAAGAAISSLGCASGGNSSASSDSNPQIVGVEAPDEELAQKLSNVDTIDTQIGSVAVLSVAENCVFTTENCDFVKKTSKKMKRVSRAHLPYGTLVWANDDNVAACLLPSDTATPLTKIGLLYLSTGNLYTVRESAVAQKEGFHIYDVRANSNGVAWVEANILDGKWRIYTARIADGGSKLEKPQMAEEGDNAWETPSIAVSGDYAFWQLSPTPSTSSKDSTSMLMRVRFGGSEEDSKCIYEAPGRMPCTPTPSESGVAIAPKANLESGSGSYYQLTHINADSGIVDSALALPSSMKPNYVAYGPTGFSFSFESIYNYGGGISNLGTYVPSGKDAPVYDASLNETAGDAGSNSDNMAVASDAETTGASPKKGEAFGEWFRFPRSPYTTPAWTNKLFLVKSTSVVAGIDLASRQYVSIEPEYALQGYGEYLASEGPLDRIVTFANIDYTPVGGDHIRECSVRVWENA